MVTEQERLTSERDKALADCDRLMTETASVSSEQNDLARQRRELMSERDQLMAERQALQTEHEKVGVACPSTKPVCSSGSRFTLLPPSFLYLSPLSFLPTQVLGERDELLRTVEELQLARAEVVGQTQAMNFQYGSTQTEVHGLPSTHVHVSLVLTCTHTHTCTHTCTHTHTRMHTHTHTSCRRPWER